ncbi:MAG: RNA polymerase sigma factor [Bacteroidales bacterium]
MAEKLEIIIKGCKRGRPKSQEALYRRFAPAMYGVCLQYASSEADAQDILQEGFIKVFTKLEQVRSPEAFPGWIRRIMINTALEKYRSKTVLHSVDELKGGGPETETDEGLIDLTCEELIRLIRDLTPKYRMVFNLYAIEGYSHHEISEMLGISVGTSKSNLSRARAILQEKIKKNYGSTIQR